MQQPLRTHVALAVLLLAAGCGDCGTKPAVPSPGTKLASTSVATGTIEGVVKFAEGATLPLAPLPVGIQQQGCPPLSEADRGRVKLDDATRGLEGVLVAASDFANSPTVQLQTHTVKIPGCRLSPLLVAATIGDTLRVENDSGVPLLPSIGANGFTAALTQGQVREITLDKAGIQTLECRLGGYCGSVELVTLRHHVRAATGPGGRFRIENAPVGKYRLNAWQVLFQDGSADVTVTAGQVTQVELVLSPAPQNAPPAAVGDGQGPD